MRQKQGVSTSNLQATAVFLWLYVLHYGTNKGSALILETVLYSQRGGANEFS